MKASDINQVARLYERGTLVDGDVLLNVYQYSQSLDTGSLSDLLAPETLQIVQTVAKQILDKLNDDAESFSFGYVTPEAPAALTSIPRTFIETLARD